MEHESLTRREARKKRKRLNKLVPLLIFAAFAFYILQEQFPQLHGLSEKVFAPHKSRIRESCQDRALAAANNADFARLLEPGTLHETQNGYYVEDVVVAEMGESGQEQRFHFNCYVDSNGNIVKTHRQD